MKPSPQKLLYRTIAAAFLAIAPFALFAQETAREDTLRKEALNVYMQTTDFIRREIPYINYMRDIRDADVYIISSDQRTGSGGKEYTYLLTGQKRFAGMTDTLHYISSPDFTEDQVRQGQVDILKQGLMRYVRLTPLAKNISITYTQPLAEEVQSDNWNSWVYKASVNGMLDGQKVYNSNQLFGNISASRITPDWKIDIGLDLEFNLDRFLIDEQEISSINNSKSFETLVVGSLGDHWSAGGNMELESSTFSNYRFKASVMPGIEYDIFPYSESTRRQLRLLYSAGYQLHLYADTTIYDKVRENLWGHSLEAAYKVVQKWGSINISLDWFNYLHDWTKNNLSVDGEIEVRIAKGLSVSFGGGGSIIHDQLSLVKGGASREEILLKRKELATQYRYFTFFGLSYTFGSIYNNVVNPRFGGSSGGMMIMMD